MQRIAVFVDAGYLAMAGATTIGHQDACRKDIRFNIKETIQAIKDFVSDKTDAQLFRIYWYDSCPWGARKTAEHSCISHQNNVKLRMGVLNTNGQQKGVDTLLVLDLFEHAIKEHITEALIISGDEDLRPGIERAQMYGVTVHLLGITNEEEEGNQSFELTAEADTISLWNKDIVEKLIKIEPQKEAEDQLEISEQIKALLLKTAQESAELVNLNDVIAYKAEQGRGMPGDIDGRLLALARDAISRNLNNQEKHFLRDAHTRIVQEKITRETEQKTE